MCRRVLGERTVVASKRLAGINAMAKMLSEDASVSGRTALLALLLDGLHGMPERCVGVGVGVGAPCL